MMFAFLMTQRLIFECRIQRSIAKSRWRNMEEYSMGGAADVIASP
jgi:hypothetical protein